MEFPKECHLKLNNDGMLVLAFFNLKSNDGSTQRYIRDDESQNQVHPLVEPTGTDSMKWVSVNDRLPGDGVIVLVLGVQNPYSLAYRHTKNPWPGKWYDNDDNEWVTGITHWMEPTLPE